MFCAYGQYNNVISNHYFNITQMFYVLRIQYKNIRVSNRHNTSIRENDEKYSLKINIPNAVFV